MPSFFDCFRSLILILGFGYASRQDRKTWMWAESVMLGFYGLMLFLFPSYLFPGSNSALLEYVVRMFAAQIIAGQYALYTYRASRDDNVIGTMLWLRMLSAGFLLLIFGYSYSQKSDLFPDKTIYFDTLLFCLILLTSAYKMWQGLYRVGGREQKGYVSLIFRVLFLLSFLTAITFMAFPTWVSFKKPDALESVMLKSYGGLLIGSSVIWWYGTSFRDDKDRSCLFRACFLSQALVFVAMCLAYFKDDVFSRQEFLSMHCYFVPLILPLIGQYLLWKENSSSSSSTYSYYLRSKSE